MSCGKVKVTSFGSGVGVGVGPVEVGIRVGVVVVVADDTSPPIIDVEAKFVQSTPPDNTHAYPPFEYPAGVQFERDDNGQAFAKEDALDN